MQYPRLALAGAQYVQRFGNWPINAHGSGVMMIVEVPGHPDYCEHQSGFRPELAERVLFRFVCDGDGEWFDVSGLRLGEAETQ